MEWRPPAWVSSAQIVLGALSIGVTLVVVLNPSYGSTTIVPLLAFAILLNSLRMVTSGGVARLPQPLTVLNVGAGLLVAVIVVIVLLSPGTGIAALTLLFATGLAAQGFARLIHTLNRGYPRWLRASALTVGLTTLTLASVIAIFPRLTPVTLVAILSVTLVVNGIDAVVSGIRPSTQKQLTLVKLVVFALFYGFINVNWMDLYYNRIPAYHIFLILTYMAPFAVLIVFQGLKDWQLAVSLGLLVSLVNDLGYYFTGDLFFGFHIRLVPWLMGQLGFEGNRVLFTFQGGLFRFHVTSYMMGASIYARLVVVFVVLYLWWRRPTIDSRVE